LTHILIVEDDASIARLLSLSLERSGYSVIWASDGNDGLAQARAARPDLILLDVMMPGMDGFQVLRSLKQQPTTRTIPVIMLTAQSDGRSVLNGIDGGAEAYLSKPIDFSDLIQRIDRWVRHRATLAARPAVA
jgi:DNA-binding response OmpR family regulator